MPGIAIIRTTKLKTMGQISGSARHTYREVPTPNADPMRAWSNEYGSAESTNDLVVAVKERLPTKRRRDAVLAIEYLVTASPEWFTDAGATAGDAYFQDALRWLAQRHGASNVVGWAVHRDESTPHLVSYVVPLDPESGRLNARRWLGGRKTLSRMQTEFVDVVARRHGLERGIEGSRAKHQQVKHWYGQIMQPDPVAVLTPEDVQRRVDETPSMLAHRLTEKSISALRPTFAAAKVSRSTTALARKMALTARTHERRYHQLVRICAPVLELRRVDAQAFEVLMQGLKLRLQRQAAVRLERLRAQSAQNTVPRAAQGAVSHEVSRRVSGRAGDFAALVVASPSMPNVKMDFGDWMK